MAKIDPEKVNEVFLKCLYLPEEIQDGKTPKGAVIVEGIMNSFGFHPGRLSEHRDQVYGWLMSLPHQFRDIEGGGWSFLAAADDEDREQWTSLHQRVEQLMVLGVGLGLAGYCLPRTTWEVLPGGMPYFSVKVEKDHATSRTADGK